MNAEDVRGWLDQNEIKVVRTEGTDPDGRLIGKHLKRTKFERSLPNGPTLTDFALGYDLAGTPQFGWWDDWRQPALGDMYQRPDLDTLTMVPSHPGEAACFCDHTGIDGTPLPVDPRSILKRVVERLGSHGLTARAAFELEFMLFTEPHTEARKKGFRDLTPLGLPKAFAYYHQSAYRMSAFMDEVLRRLDGYGVPWEAWDAEAAPAQVELNFAASDPVAAADNVVRAKSVLREVAFDLGHSVTFMAKASEAFGNGMHIHHSVQQKDGSSAFYDAVAADGRSALMRHWIGGLIETMPAAHSFLTPTINSFRRMVGFAAAPLVVGWAEENKSTALRTVSRSEKLSRVEHRVGSGDLNPYLALAAMLGGGIVGIEQGIEPPPEMQLLAWGLPDRFPYLPSTITAAADALEQDKPLTDILGPSLILHWVQTRRWEWMMYHTTGGDPEAQSVTDWELDRYFEVV